MTSSISSVGFAKRVSAPRSVVPACEPFMPESDSRPMDAATSSRERPMTFAMGAMYFMASPVSYTEAFVRAAVSARTSATCEAAPASRPKPRSVVAAMSEATAKSSPLDAARSSMPGMASTISLTEKPAEARFCMPSAACVALNDVDAPRLFAVSLKSRNSESVALVSARTPLIPSSNPLKVLRTSLAPMPIPTNERAIVIGLLIMFQSFRNGAVMKSFILMATLHVFPARLFALFQTFFKIGEALSIAESVRLSFSLNMLRKVLLLFSIRWLNLSALALAPSKEEPAFCPALFAEEAASSKASAAAPAESAVSSRSPAMPLNVLSVCLIAFLASTAPFSMASNTSPTVLLLFFMAVNNFCSVTSRRCSAAVSVSSTASTGISIRNTCSTAHRLLRLRDCAIAC